MHKLKSLHVVAVAIAAFSVLFFGLRIYGRYVDYNIDSLVADLGGLTYLYSTIGTIFAVFAAFAIVSESQDWNLLRAATKDEVRDLNEFLLWSKKLSANLSRRCERTIEEYLETVINKEWQSLSDGSESTDAEPMIETLHDLVMEAGKENADVASHLFAVLAEFLNDRAIRMEYSWQPLPAILKLTIILVASAVMGLSLFIGVKNMWLDYLFVGCIVTLVTIILVVIDDLDNPLRPGEWYLTSNNHQRLLDVLRPPRQYARQGQWSVGSSTE